MRKLFSIFLLSLFLYEIAGFFMAFPMIEFLAEQKMTWKIHHGSQSQDLIRVPLSWEQNGNSFFEITGTNEFRYRGHLYDIASKEEKGDSIIYHVLRDENEEALFTKLDRKVNELDEIGLQPVKSSSKQILKDPVKEYLLAGWPKCILHDRGLPFHFYIQEKKILSQSSQVLTPPPQLA